MGLITLNISAKPNEPPNSSGWFRILVDFGNTHTFTSNEFVDTTPAYNDPEGDDLKEVKILTTPLKGFIKKNGVNINPGDIITVPELDSGDLVYHPDNLSEGYIDSTTTFVVADVGSSTFTTSPKQIFINVLYDPFTENQAPDSVGDGSASGDVGFTFVFTRDYLTTQLNPPYSDPENNPAYKLLILQKPESGRLLLDGIEVVDNQEIFFGDQGDGTPNIDNGDLVYTNDEYPSGGVDGFNFQISDTISQQFTG